MEGDFSFVNGTEFAFGYGLMAGFLLSLMLGTVFFFLIQSSISHGFKAGVFISSGVILSDVLFISIALFGTSLIPHIENNQGIIEAGGGIVLLILGTSLLFSKSVSIKYPESKLGNFAFFFSKGFLLNLLNPVNFFSWLAIVTFLKGAKGYEDADCITFFAGSLAAIFGTEILLAFSSIKVKRLLNDTLLKRINQFSGILFLGFGLYLIGHSLGIY